MRLPMKVSTATSNFMIGVTAAASAGVYFWRGDVVPAVAAPVALGVLIGASVGAQLLVRFPNVTVRLIFIPVLLGVGVEMLLARDWESLRWKNRPNPSSATAAGRWSCG